MKDAFILLLMTLASITSHAQIQTEEIPSKFTYQGRITHSNGSAVEDASVSFTVQVRSADGSCVLFEESHVRNMTHSNGMFSLAIGGGTNSGATTLTLKQAFDNSNAKLGANGCNYAPNPGDIRRLRFSFDTGTEIVTLPQDQSIVSVPYAMHANTLQGLGPSDFFKVGSGAVTQTNLNLLLNNTSNILSLANGSSNLYAAASSFPSRSGLSNGQFLTWDGSLQKWVGQTLSEATLPVLTQPGHVSGNVIVNGTIGGTTTINTTGTVTSSAVSSTTLSAQNLQLYESSNANRIQIQAPSNLSTNYVLTLPPNTGSSGYRLTTDGLGNLSWSRTVLNDLRSTIGGTLFPTGCTSNQTWNYQSATDSFICVNVTLQGKAISSTPVADGDVLKYSSTTQRWEPSQVRNSPFSNAQVFDASGAFTVPAGVTRLYVQAWGGGGGGGGGGTVLSLGVPTAIGGGGGGGGAYGASFITVIAGSSLSVVIGAGGAAGALNGAGGGGGVTSFGSYVSVSGGSGGAAASTASALGGSSTTALINQAGSRGSPANAIGGGLGGSSPQGGSGGPGASGSLVAVSGFDGTAPGGAGGGGTSTTAGGAGAAGRVIVWY